MKGSHVQVEKIRLNHDKFIVNGLIFIPGKLNFKLDSMCIFTHGYTSSKSDLISWGTRLSESGIISVIFDLPGHYLGSFNEVDSFDDFKSYAHELFGLAYKEGVNYLLNSTGFDQGHSFKLILGGHSLGGLLALKASELIDLKDFKKDIYFICVGLGVNPSVKLHLFDSEFYQKTLNIRKQLVSSSISPDVVFPWIKDHKHNITISDSNITLLCGLDDIVVGKGGGEYLKNILTGQKNKVELIEPTHLPHHEPGLASGHLNQIVKKLLN